MKYKGDRNIKIGTLIRFPSPCGEEVMKSSAIGFLINGVFLFPSPCGEEVMKLFTAHS